MGQRTALGLTGVLLVYFALRVPGLGWGLPPTTPEVRASDFRTSYSPDEDDVLSAVSFLDPGAGRWDVRVYHWGTLHFLLMYPYMRLAEHAGLVTSPWREAYYHLAPGGFERVYEIGRSFSVLMGAATVLLTFLLGRQCASEGAGMWAALWIALSPAHLLTSTQVRVDLTMTALVILTAWLAVRGAPPLCTGLAAGLAAAAKHTAILQVAPILLVAYPSPRLWPKAIAGFAVGLLAGEPWWVTHGAEIVRQLTLNLEAKTAARGAAFLGNISDMARFTTGLPLFVLSLAGLWLLRAHRVLAAALAGGVLILILMQESLLRFHMVLLPFLAVAGGAALSALRPRRAAALGIVASIPMLFASLAQLDYMRSPQPATEILPIIYKEVPPGSPIARVFLVVPPLDRSVYPMAENPLLRGATSEWVLLTDLAQSESSALDPAYRVVADKRLQRRFAWATLGERGAPHDWKYTHASMTLYRRSP
jgi:4-amino-4-deoxy-L-arabinose transferase-like glycosyltransferase